MTQQGTRVAFEPVEPKPSLPDLERRVLARWRERGVVARAAAARPGAPSFAVQDGPPTVNGEPGAHHVPNRVFKDTFRRHRAMTGRATPLGAGWDCHGIPVELEVERALGLGSKRGIEDYGVARFNQRCRELVERSSGAWASLYERIAYWFDPGDTYATHAPSYVDSVWWSLKELWDRGLLYEGRRAVPYCPRCGTALSDHEVAQGSAEAPAPTVTVRLPVLGGPLAADGAALLAWTTEPWTLVANAAAAVSPHARYVLAAPGGAVPHAAGAGPVVLADGRVEAVLGPGARVLREVPLGELAGAPYRAPYTFLDPPGGPGGAWRRVLTAEFVSPSEGTGVVHVAPGHGADDLELARLHGLPVVGALDAEGRLDRRVTPWAGMFFAEASGAVVADLRERGLAADAGAEQRERARCWRCATPLAQVVRPSWYVATTRVRERMLEHNARVAWHPAAVGEGRFGNWLRDGVDWALSRERYWGTPLPLWRCDACGDVRAVASRAELGRLAGRDLSALDPHRPFVDEIALACRCGGTARRVPEVVDAWYDSGCVGFAQVGYPHVPGSERRLAQRSPADLVAEGVDQTRGWFYSLLAVSTLLFDRPGYERVLCLGLVVDAAGRKMSTSRGNALDPWGLLDGHGADALRWLLLTGGSPWGDQRVGAAQLEEVTRRFLLRLWNTYGFLATYARIDGWSPGHAAPPVPERPVMDRWVLAELAATVTRVDAALEALDAAEAGRHLERFVADLSTWYVRRTRARFWAAGDGADKRAAYATLHACLLTVSRLLAPMAPFLADELHERLAGAGAAASVHLEDYPAADPATADDGLRAAMASARRVVELGRRARDEAGLPLRQPLRRALVALPGAERAGWAQVRDVVVGELNVKELELVDAMPDGGAAGVRTAGDGTRAVALDTTLDDALRRERLARDLAREVNRLRRRAGVGVDERIRLRVEGDGPVEAALDAHGPWVAGETLAVELRRGPVEEGDELQLAGGARARVALERS